MRGCLDGVVSRLPNPLRLVPELGEIGSALFRATGNGSVPRSTIGLLQLRAGQIVGNDYLTTLHTGNLRKPLPGVSPARQWRQ